MKITLTVLAIGFILYILWIALLYGIKKSISESYYFLQQTGHGYFFTIFMLFITICLMIISIKSASIYSWLFSSAGCGAAFVGVAASYQQKITRGVHFIGASTLILGSLLGIGLVYDNWMPTFFLGLFLLFLILTKDIVKNPVYWFEIAAFVFILFGLYIEAI